MSRDNIRIRNEFMKCIMNFKRQPGCYDVNVVNNRTGEEASTQGDLKTDDTWFDFYRWLEGDIREMGIGDIEDISIISISFAGTENFCGDENELKTA